MQLHRLVPVLTGWKPRRQVFSQQSSNIKGYHGFNGQFFCIFEIIIFSFVVAMCKLVQDVEAIHILCYDICIERLICYLRIAWDRFLIFNKELFSSVLFIAYVKC